MIFGLIQSVIVLCGLRVCWRPHKLHIRFVSPHMVSTCWWVSVCLERRYRKLKQNEIKLCKGKEEWQKHYLCCLLVAETRNILSDKKSFKILSVFRIKLRKSRGASPLMFVFYSVHTDERRAGPTNTFWIFFLLTKLTSHRHFEWKPHFVCIKFISLHRARVK